MLQDYVRDNLNTKPVIEGKKDVTTWKLVREYIVADPDDDFWSIQNLNPLWF